jgi:hypothetical protein
MYPKCGNLCGQKGRKRFIANWGLRLSHICPCTPCPSPQGIGQRSKVVILPTSGIFPFALFYCSLCCSPINSDNCSAVWTAGNPRPSSYPTPSPPRVAIFRRKKNYSEEYGTDGNMYSFRRGTVNTRNFAITRKIKKSSEFRSEALRTVEERNTQIFVISCGTILR